MVDDGSTDDTAARAARAATTLILPVNWGKGDAVRFAVEQYDEAEIYLLVDADLGSTAHHTVRLLDPVRRAPPTSPSRRFRRLADGVGSVR